MELVEWLRALDPRMLGFVALLAVIGLASDQIGVARARGRVQDYLRTHRYTVKRLRRSWRPRIGTTRSRHSVHFSVEAYDLEFDVRRRGWARASSSLVPMFEDDVRVEWEGEPEEFGSALPARSEERSGQDDLVPLSGAQPRYRTDMPPLSDRHRRG